MQVHTSLIFDPQPHVIRHINNRFYAIELNPEEYVKDLQTYWDLPDDKFMRYATLTKMTVSNVHLN
jgi:hypothetical protein